MSTTARRTPLDVTVGDADPWPIGRLDLIGAVVDRAPGERDRPHIRLNDETIEVYVASLALANGSASADVRWDRKPAESTIRFRTGSWNVGDGEAATEALRWLETFPRPLSGAPRLEDDPGWRAAMREIDAYLKKPGTSQKTAVDRFWDYLVSLGDLVARQS